jgi:hypothetical protein
VTVDTTRGEWTRPPFAGLLTGRRPDDRPRLRTRVRRIARLARDDPPTDARRGTPTPLSVLRLAGLFGPGTRERRRAGDANRAVSDTPPTTEPTRPPVARRIAVTRETSVEALADDRQATDVGSRRPPGAGDRTRTLAHRLLGAGDDRPEPPRVAGGDPVDHYRSDDADRRHEQSDRRRITTLRSTGSHDATAFGRRRRSTGRLRRSVAAVTDRQLVGDAVGDRLSVSTAGPGSGAGDQQSTVGSGGPTGRPSGVGSTAGTGRPETAGRGAAARTGAATPSTGTTGRSADTTGTHDAGATSAGRGQRGTRSVLPDSSVRNDPSLVVARDGSGAESHSARSADDATTTGVGRETDGRVVDSRVGNDAGRHGPDSSPSSGSSAVDHETERPASSSRNASDGVTLPSATVDRIVDRLSRRLQRDRRIARERGDR